MQTVASRRAGGAEREGARFRQQCMASTACTAGAQRTEGGGCMKSGRAGSAATTAATAIWRRAAGRRGGGGQQESEGRQGGGQAKVKAAFVRQQRAGSRQLPRFHHDTAQTRLQAGQQAGRLTCEQGPHGCQAALQHGCRVSALQLQHQEMEGEKHKIGAGQHIFQVQQLTNRTGLSMQTCTPPDSK